MSPEYTHVPIVNLRSDGTMTVALNPEWAALLWAAAEHAVTLADEPAQDSTLLRLHDKLAEPIPGPRNLVAYERQRPVIATALGGYAAAQLLLVEAGFEDEDSAAAQKGRAALELMTAIESASYHEPSTDERFDLTQWKTVMDGVKAVEAYVAEQAPKPERKYSAGGTVQLNWLQSGLKRPNPSKERPMQTRFDRIEETGLGLEQYTAEYSNELSRSERYERLMNDPVFQALCRAFEGAVSKRGFKTDPPSAATE